MKLEIISLFIMTVLTSYGHIMIKHSSSHLFFTKNPVLLFKQMLEIKLLSGVAAVLFAPFLYFYALKTLDLNTAYSFTAFSQILIPGLSFVFFKERITVKKISAILLIASGILIWNL